VVDERVIGSKGLAGEARMNVVDFARVADRLPDSHKVVRQLIRDTSALHSAHTDLKMAHDFAVRFIEMDQADELPRSFVEDCGLALLCSAIVFYTRATKSQSDHRKTFDMRAQMDDLEKGRHDMLVRLRDDAIAHYGPGDLGSATVREDWLFFSPVHLKPLGVSRNIAGSRNLAHVIREQSQRAVILTQRLFEMKQGRLVDQINDLAEDETFLAAWDAGEIRLADAVGEQMAAQIERGPFIGTSRLHERQRPQTGGAP
jgi:hypothetical protein